MKGDHFQGHGDSSLTLSLLPPPLLHQGQFRTLCIHLPLASCDSGPLPLGQHDSILFALLTCLKLPQSYANTQRGDCFEVFFPGTLAVLLSFSNLEHKTPSQKTEAKLQPPRNCWISLLRTTLQKSVCCFFAYHCYSGNAFITEKQNSTHVLHETPLVQYQKVAFTSEFLTLVRKKKSFVR